jgi:hypothetical protein
MRSARRTTLGLMLGLVFPVAGAEHLAAQQPETIPTAVALGTLGPFAGMFGGAPRFTSGTAPVDWPATLLPAPPARVLGGVAFPLMQSAVFSYVGNHQETMEAYGAVLARAGWRSAREESSGFVPAPTSTRVFCADSGFLTIMPLDTVPGRTTISVLLYSMRTGMFSPACGGGDRVRTLSMGSGVQLPTLKAPDGAQGGAGTRTMASGGEESTATRVTTTLEPGALLAHYSAQLAAAGWVTGRSITASDHAIQTVEHRDAGGQRYVGTLELVRHAANYVVTLRVTKLAP